MPSGINGSPCLSWTAPVLAETDRFCNPKRERGLHVTRPLAYASGYNFGKSGDARLGPRHTRTISHTSRVFVRLSPTSPFKRRITLDDFTTQRSSFQKPAKSSSEVQPLVDLKDYVITYARERPDVALLTCLGLGFILGWKLKPW